MFRDSTHPRLASGLGSFGTVLARVSAGTLLGLGALLWSAEADASKSYGYYLIQSFDFRPGCQGCHATGEGGAGTVVQPFGLTMIRYGLRGGDNFELLIQTLNAVDMAGVDSDGDGAPDTVEVMDFGDPNDPEVFPEGFEPPADTVDDSMMPAADPAGGSPAPPPESGCRVSQAGAVPHSGLLLGGFRVLAFLALAGVIWRRRKPR